MSNMILGKHEAEWHRHVPITADLQALKEICWINPRYVPVSQAVLDSPLSMADIRDASDRLARFAPYLMEVFPETAATGGILESPLRRIDRMQAALEEAYGCTIPGSLWLKMDSHLAISGSIKARGGIYEVLKTAEDIALRHGLLKPGDDYRVLAEDRFRQLFSRYEIAVGSTGNLGLSIGIMSAALGFRVTVHMSADARQWKKDLLRQKGVQVVEYAADYSVAITQGRKLALQNPMCIFIDDENSQTLFLGYAVAALRLARRPGEPAVAAAPARAVRADPHRGAARPAAHARGQPEKAGRVRQDCAQAGRRQPPQSPRGCSAGAGLKASWRRPT